MNKTSIYAGLRESDREVVIVEGSPFITNRQWRQAVALLIPPEADSEAVATQSPAA